MEPTTITAMAGDAQLDTSSNPARLIISGQWTLANYARLKKLTEQLAGKYDASTHIDLDDVSRLDTAGASLLVELLGAERVSQLADSATKLPRPTAPCCKPCIPRCVTFAYRLKRSKSTSAFCC